MAQALQLAAFMPHVFPAIRNLYFDYILSNAGIQSDWNFNQIKITVLSKLNAMQ